MVYNIMRGIVRVNAESITTMRKSRARENRFKVREERFNRNFFQRAVGIGSELPEEVIEAGTLTAFKRHWTSEQIGKIERDMCQWWANATSLARNLVRHGQVGLQGLFPWSMTL